MSTFDDTWYEDVFQSEHESVEAQAHVLACLAALHMSEGRLSINLLTSDPDSTIHYTNSAVIPYGQKIDEASTWAESPPSWTEWRTHRVDWLHNSIRF